jgi:hypothetical protein
MGFLIARPAAALCALVLLLCAACAMGSRHDAKFETAPEPIRSDWELTKLHCGQCHTLDRAFLNMELWSSRDDVEWLVIDMSSQPGANMSDAEIDRIIDVLDWYRRQ